MDRPYNPHIARKQQARQNRLIQQMSIALPIIRSTKLGEGEQLHGVIYWDRGLVVDEDRSEISTDEMKRRKCIHGQNACVFRYDGTMIEQLL